MTNNKIITLSMAAILAVSLIASTNFEVAVAQEKIEGKLTSPTEDNSLYGGEETGTIQIEYNENDILISAKLNMPPSEGMVYEGWLVDTNLGYALSTGQLDNNNGQIFEQGMVNPYIYDVYVITEEPVEDKDPKPNAIHVGGIKIPSPFGQ
ncbi:MAG: hypothetical protein ACPKPY_08660 [Nitrososphaeraceae archaeon]